MLFRVWKNKKIGDAVLTQVWPLLNSIGRMVEIDPRRLAADRYVLGFFCANIGLEMRRVANGPLPPVQQGTILFLVLQQLFGKDTVTDREIGDLLNGVPAVNEEFRRGCDVALKIQAAASGHHKLQDDSDYLAAQAAVRLQGDALDFLGPSHSEDSKIAGEMLRSLYYQHVMDRHGTAADRER